MLTVTFFSYVFLSRKFWLITETILVPFIQLQANSKI